MHNPNAYDEAGFQSAYSQLTAGVELMWMAGASVSDIANTIADALSAAEGCAAEVDIKMFTGDTHNMAEIWEPGSDVRQ